MDIQTANKHSSESRLLCLTLCFGIFCAVAASKTSSLIKAIIVAVVASISVPLLGSLLFSLIVAPIVWFYGFVVAILLFPMSFLLTLAASVWLGVRTYLKGWFSLTEAVVAVAASATATSFVLDSDSILGVNALPNVAGQGRLIGHLMFLLIGLAFAAFGAVATQLLVAKMSLIRDPKADATVDSDQIIS